jgi:hypothetical protein
MKLKFSLLILIILASFYLKVKSKNSRKGRNHLRLHKVHSRFHTKSSAFYDLPRLAQKDIYEENDPELEKILKGVVEVKGHLYGLRSLFGISQNDASYLIVVFRGTETELNRTEKEHLVHKNVILDLKFNQVDYSKDGNFCVNCKVHFGITEAFKDIREGLFAAILDKTQKNPSIKKIIITGHSLGGALANLFSYEYTYRKQKATSELEKKKFADEVSLITFGSPRVGNVEFANHMDQLITDKKLKRHYRVIYGEDPCTHIPPSHIKKGDEKTKDWTSIKDFMIKVNSLIFGYKLKMGQLDELPTIDSDLIYKHAGKEIHYSRVPHAKSIEDIQKKINESQIKISKEFVEKEYSDTAFWSTLHEVGKDHSVYKFMDGRNLWKSIKKEEKPENKQ